MKRNRIFSPMKAIMLLLLLGFAAGNAMAQNDKAIRGHEGGLKGGEPPYLNKVYKEPVGGSNVGTLTLETYATGETILTEKRIPTDIVLVLDMSGSMDNPMYEPKGPRNWTYNDRNNDSNDPFYYKDGDTYRAVTFGKNNGRYYIRFRNADNNWRYLNASGNVVNTQPNNGPTDSGGTIFSGTLYTAGENKLAALKNAVSQFIDIIDNDAQTHLDEHGNPVDHKISIVKFAGNRYSGTGESDLTEGDETTYISHNGRNYEHNYAQVVKKLTVVRTTASQSNANALKTAVNNLRAVGATASDYGMTKAKYVLDQSVSTEENPRKKVVVMFTDGEPNYFSGFDNDVANNCIAASKTMKDAGAVVYTVGVFGSTSNEIDTYMSYTSSKYPNAQSMTNGGSPVDGNFYFTAQTSDQLEDIFTSIAEQSGSEPMSMGSETIVQDIISEYFKLPEGAIPEDIKVFIADCNGVSSHPQSGQTYDERGRSFVLENEWFEVTASTNPSITDMVTFTDNNTNIQVTGFDFSGNWCGWNDNLATPGVQGKKLVIQIPIVPKDNTWGDNLDTNGEMSILIPNGDESEVFYYPKPLTTIVRKTWVDVVHRSDLVPDGTWVEENGVIKLKSKEALAWFISYVNGYNGEPVHEKAKGVLEVDVDMSEWNWVPIGGMEGYWIYNENDEVVGWQASQCITGFEGTFDGNGHAIRGLRNQATVVPVAGMFGTLNGAEVKNTFVVDCNFQTGREGYFGIIADSIFNGAVIYNCEASGILRTHNINPAVAHESDPNYYAGLVTYEPINAHLGGIVGLVGRDRANGASSGEVHSCISTAYLKGYDMGGLVSELDNKNCLLNNCFSYPAYHIWDPTQSSSIGGFASTNKAGKIQNCYLRERSAVVTGESNDYHYGINGIIQYIASNQNGKGYTQREDDTKYRFNGLFVGENLATLNYCYYPEYGDGVTVAPFVSAKPTGYSGTLVQAGGVGKFTATSTPYMYKHADNDVTLESSTGSNSYIKSDDTWPRFLKTMNNWVEANGPSKYTKWFRTTADGVNNDYPVLKIMDFNTVGSDDQVVLFYGDINEMMGMTGTDTPTPTRYFLTEGKSDDVMCLYQNAAVTTGNNGATLYINEDVAIKQTQPLTAYVGITLDNSAHDANGGASQNNPNDPAQHEYGENTRDWHMFSTSLSNAPLGVNYNNDNTQWPFFYDGAEGAPAMTRYAFYAESEQDGYFPSHTYGKTDGESGYNYYTDWDYYCWSEPYNHWINFKRNSASHWAENIQDLNLGYTNEETLTPGKGYLLAIANETFLQSHGTLNRDAVSINLTNSPKNYYSCGFNLIGNPYQSYLDFDAFAEENGIDSYTILDEDAGGYVTYAATGSMNSRSASQHISMHQGFLVYTDGSVSEVTFTDDMRGIEANAGEDVSFRGNEKASYTLVNLIVTESDGKREIVTVETGRPEQGGARKMMGLLNGKSQLYAHCDGESYSVLFATDEMHTVPVRFRTYQDDSFTLTWDVENGSLDELYLVDNITGQTIDMLTHSQYVFEGRTTDFSSRFKLVFGNGTVDEPAEGEVIEDIFAYQNEDNLMVTSEGHFEMYDMSGRLVQCVNLYNDFNTVALPRMSRGVYTLRLTNNTDTKVQKIVIR